MKVVMFKYVQLTLTSAHVTTGLEQHGCLFVRADDALLNLWRDISNNKQGNKKGLSTLHHVSVSGWD